MATMLRNKAFSSCSNSRTAQPIASSRGLVVRCRAQQQEIVQPEVSRRVLLQQASALAAAAVCSSALPAVAASAGTQRPLIANEGKVLCDADCVAGLESLEKVTTASGLQYRDIIVGRGPVPPVGYQVTVNYVAMTPNGRAFDSSLEKGAPYDIRVGAGQVIPGLDEGLKSMKTGGLRRLYIPGELAFPKGLKAAAGRPSVPPASPVMFDVQLLFIPGFEVDELDE